jgi:hypothetical protein
VHLSKTTPATLADGRKAWALSLTADFRQINLFLFLIEKMFTIETLSVVSGQPTSKHAVEMTVAEMIKTSSVEAAHNDVIDRYTGKDLFIMYDEVARLLSSVDRRRKILDAYTPPTRDLLMYSDTLFYVPADNRPVAARVRVRADAPPVKIDDIYWDPDVPVVVVGGKALRIGDVVAGAKIVAIHQKNIVVKYHDKEFTVTK